jgi:hypothetical protein
MRYGWSFNRFIILALALISIILHLAFYNNLEYHRDELLYFSLGMHPAGGYATTPPLIGWLAFILLQTLGHSIFVVKLLPALGSGLLVILTAAITRELGGSVYARILSATGILLAPLFLRAFFLFQPVFLDILFWTLAFYVFIRYINTQNPTHLLYLGIVCGFGMLNKYLIGLLIAILLIMVLFTKYRHIYRMPQLYLAFMIALMIFIPNLVWQVRHHFPVFHHMSALHDTQLVHVNRSYFLLEQLVMVYMVSLLTIPGLIFLISNQAMKPYRVIAYTIILVLLALLVMRGKSYYTAGVFPTLIAAGAVFWERTMRRRMPRLVLPLLMILLTLPMIPLGLPVLKAPGLARYFDVLEERFGMDLGRRWEDGRIHRLPQDYADMVGWEELVYQASRAYEMVEDKEHCILYGENYGHAGALAIIGKRYGLPEPFSFHDAFRYWLPDRFEHEITTMIYVNTSLGEDVRHLFNDITEVGRLEIPYAREYGTSVFLCRTPKQNFNNFYKQLPEERSPPAD